MIRKSLVAFLVALSLTISQLPNQTAHAAGPESVSLQQVLYPTSVVAGETVKFEVHATPSEDEVLCCGDLIVTSPSDQSFRVRLVQTRPGILQGELQTSPHAAPGEWKISELYVSDSAGEVLDLSAGPRFQHTFRLQTSGKSVDTTAPKLTSISLPEEVVGGDIFTITAQAADNLAGIDRIYAQLQPEAVTDTPLWTLTVELFPTGSGSEYSGQMVADPILAEVKHQIVSVTLYDRAGNRVVLDGKSLASNSANKLAVRVKERELPEGVVTSPYMNLIHAGNLGYWAWLDQDRTYIRDLLKSGNDTLIQERMAAELPQLRAMVDQLRGEVYVDPTTQLKISPYATTGKWLVLDAAIWARMELLTEVERRKGLTHERREKLTLENIDWIYAIVDEDEMMPAFENTVNDRYGQVPAAVLSLLAKSPEAVAALRMPAHESENYGVVDALDRDVIYFSPIISTDHSAIRWGQNSFELKIDPTSQITNLVRDFFYDIGRHLGQATLSAFDAPDAVKQWSKYYELRGGEAWNLGGGAASPENNLGDDFAWTFLPGGLAEQYYSIQSLKPLRTDPKMAEAFSKFVKEKLATPAPETTFTPTSFFEVGISGEVKAIIAPSTAAPKAAFWGFRWDKTEGSVDLTPSAGGKETTFRSSTTELGRVAVYQLLAKDSVGRPYFRPLYYYRSSVLLDPVPGATNKPTLRLTGTTLSNQRVTIGSNSAKADSKGKFELNVPLKEGVNDLQLTVGGVSLGASLQVRYEPADRPVKLEVTLPGATRDESIYTVVKTEPFALLTAKGMTAAADAKGQVPLLLPIDEGTNNVEILVTTVAGTTATWKGTIIKDTKPPEILLNVPLVTNQQTYVMRGSVDPGSTLTINETVVPVAGDGSFQQSVSLTEGKATVVKAAATDAAGNRSEKTVSLTYSSLVAPVALQAPAEVRGKADSGHSLSYQGRMVAVDSTGVFSLRLPLEVGLNTIVLTVTADGQPAGFHEYQVLLPVKVESKLSTEPGKTTLTGKTLPGYLVIAGDRLATVKEDGSFTVTVDQVSGPVVLTITGDGKSFQVEVPLP